MALDDHGADGYRALSSSEQEGVCSKQQREKGNEKNKITQQRQHQQQQGQQQ